MLLNQTRTTSVCKSEMLFQQAAKGPKLIQKIHLIRVIQVQVRAFLSLQDIANTTITSAAGTIKMLSFIAVKRMPPKSNPAIEASEPALLPMP